MMNRISMGAALVFASSLTAQSQFAGQVIASQTNGGAGGGIFAPQNALGAPSGGGLVSGSSHVHSLGVAGTLTLSFSPPISDGPGADLLVAENPFAATFGEVFAEVCFVEVSSDGVRFARFPSAYLGLPTNPGAFGTVTVGSYENLAGQTPVLAGSIGFPGADPRDVVEAGGDAFDLAELRGHPLVSAGSLDLGAIAFVRLVDVVGGTDVDSSGTVIRDAGAGSADIDAVTAIHQQGAGNGRGPRVSLRVPPDGRFVLDLDDPDGWRDLDPGSLRSSVQGMPVDARALLSSCRVVRADATGFSLQYPRPLPPGLRFRVSFSVKDRSGQRSGASRSRE